MPSEAAKSPTWLVGLVWLVLTLPGVALTLHSLAIAPVLLQTVPLTALQHVEGFAYMMPLPPSTSLLTQSPAETAYEDGQPLPLRDMPGWGVVAKQGAGRYLVTDNTVFLSATDNSDPRTNGRTYTVVRPHPISRRVIRLFWAVGLVGTLGVFLLAHGRILRFLARPPFVLAAACLCTLVAANRAWMFVDYPLVSIQPDSGSYFAVAEQIGGGTWPNFGNRPPAYPLFMRAVFAFEDRAIFLAACQTALSLIASMLLVFGAYRWHRALGLPAAIVMSLYMFGYSAMEHDTAMLSESLYASCLMLSFGGLILALQNRSAAWLGFASAVMALAILTRPAGMFLVGTYALVAAWLVGRRFSWRATAAFLIPFPLLLASMSLYNLRVVKAFAPTTWGEANLAVATFLYWETDANYPAQINEDIKRIQAGIATRYARTKKDRTLLDRSWDPDGLAPIFLESFDAPSLDIAMHMGRTGYETAGRQWIRRIAVDSIRKHPGYYTKFVWTMLYQYFKPAPEYDFRAFMQNRAWTAYVARQFAPEQGNPLLVRLGKEFAQGVPPPGLILLKPDGTAPAGIDSVVIPPTRLWRVYQMTNVARRLIFSRWVWSIAVFVALVGSVFVLCRTRLRHDASFVVFIITVSALGASLVVSLVEYSQPRYSYPMEWVYGMSVVLFPMLFVRPTLQSDVQKGRHARMPKPVVA